MSTTDAQIYYDEKGKPMMVQMGIGEYEKLVLCAKEAVTHKELIQKTLSMLKGSE
jgi:hypothetical protein